MECYSAAIARSLLAPQSGAVRRGACRKVSRSTSKYLEVLRSTYKYLKVHLEMSSGERKKTVRQSKSCRWIKTKQQLKWESIFTHLVECLAPSYLAGPDVANCMLPIKEGKEIFEKRGQDWPISPSFQWWFLKETLI